MGMLGSDAILNGSAADIPAIVIIDPYVAGYITAFTVVTMSFVYNGKDWNSKKRMEYFMESWKTVGLSVDNCHVYAQVMADPSAEAVWDKDGQYSAGKEAAFLAFGSANGILNDDDLQSEIIINARKRAAEMMGIDADLGLGAGDNSSLAAAVCELTIQKHMKKYYSGNLL